MTNDQSKLLLLSLLVCFCLSLCFQLTAPALAQDVSPPSIDIELPEGADEFGTADFTVEQTVTEAQAASWAWFLAIISSLCTGIPAMIVGLVVGYFVGKSRAPRPTAEQS